jgi:signal transduction histidine kinase
MHPLAIRGRGRGVYLSLAQWSLVGSLLAALLSAQPGIAWPQALALALPLAAIYAFVCGSSWYLARALPLNRTGVPQVALTALSAALVSSGAWVMVAGAWMGALGRLWSDAPPSSAFPGLRTPIFTFGLVVYLLSLAVSYLLGAVDESQQSERRGLEAQVLAREAELRSLRAQIDPHFLFNSLHSISALTTADPPAARRMCVLLADFLRDSLALGAHDRIPLGRELALVRQFLEIEQVRYGDRLHIEISGGEAEACQVPPLLLQPLVENAVTHGIAHTLAGGTVSIAASRSPGRLAIAIENPCDPDRPRRTGTGVGLTNVRARLRALHGDDARLDTLERDGRWRVAISLPPCDPAPAASGDDAPQADE